jgi:hypothetical protein
MSAGCTSVFQAPKSRYARIEAVTNGRLARLSFSRHPAFSYKVRQEGYKDFVFGARMGPSAGFGGLAHDMGHAVDFGPENFDTRCTRYGFEFHVPQVEIMGEYYPECVTGQASERECRAFGIEWKFLEAAGVYVDENIFLAHVCGSLGFMPDWIAYHQKPEEVRALLHAGRDRFTMAEICDRMVGWLDQTPLEQLHAA